eukprot:GDKH01016260.1.p1 GENE.GDKH01016260.1~~GDKH01016260.1.p1  ORF type:complete len:75 (-),score=15.03 GDKH01016260.1:382-606(-)
MVSEQSGNLARDKFWVYEVPALVGNIKNDAQECAWEKGVYDKQQLNKGIGRFFQPKKEEEKVQVKKQEVKTEPS